MDQWKEKTNIFVGSKNEGYLIFIRKVHSF